MSIGTDKLAAATTTQEVMAVKSVLEIERDSAQSLFDEYTEKSNQAKIQASNCRSDIHNVPTLLKNRVWAIFNQSQGDA